MRLARTLAIAGWLVDGLLLALVATVLISVAIATIGPQIGHPVLIIRGGSMEPAVALGSLTVLDGGDPADLRVGDIVAFQAPNGTTVTHRVVRFANLGPTPYVGTKGDANAEADPVITARSAILGRVAWTIPAAGYLLALLAEPAGVVMVFLVAATLLAFALLLEEVSADLRDRAAAGTGGRSDAVARSLGLARAAASLPPEA